MTPRLTAARLWSWIIPIGLMWALLTGAVAPSRTYDAAYAVELRPADKIAAVSITLKGERLPSRLTFAIDPDAHFGFAGSGRLETSGDTVVWYPDDGTADLRYSVRIDRKLESGSYNSHINPRWAVFRGDRLVPPVSIRAVRGLTSRATLAFKLPERWSVLTPYAADSAGRFVVTNPDRRFDRPAGWMVAGELGSRQESIVGVSTTVAAPVGEDARRQDVLAFLNWNLPHLHRIFPEFPGRLLVVIAGDPMFRGGLSGPASLFMHADRPLISENRTSTLLHELVHVAMRLSGDGESDWIVEGFAEYFSLEVLRRSGGIGEQRYRDAIRRLGRWGQDAPTLFIRNSSGAVTARAVGVLAQVDAEIRRSSDNRASLDDVARELAGASGNVTLERLQDAVGRAAGRRLPALERENLMRPTSARVARPAPFS